MVRRIRPTSKHMRGAKPGELPCRFTAFFDGCCEPTNPGGTAGYGAVIFDKGIHCREGLGAPSLGDRVHEITGMIPAAPTTSNNVAEYLAINSIMDWLLGNGYANESIHAYGDSRLVICQLWGWPVVGQRWKIHGVDCPAARGLSCKGCRGKKGFYADDAVHAREKLTLIPRMNGFWIPREENNIADELSKAELKKSGVEFRIQPEDAMA